MAPGEFDYKSSVNKTHVTERVASKPVFDYHPRNLERNGGRESPFVSRAQNQNQSSKSKRNEPIVVEDDLEPLSSKTMQIKILTLLTTFVIVFESWTFKEE